MIDVCLLGTGGMMPLPDRWLTSMVARYNGSSLLIDCGEGTQIAMKENGISCKPIDVMCFTHYHADHISGLPGMLLSMGNADRTEPVTMIGPKGLERVVNALRVIAPDIPFEVKFIELNNDFESFKINGYLLEAFKIKHGVPCYEYTMKIERKGKFNLENAMALGIDKCYWNKLQNGIEVEVDGKLYTPEMVLGEERKGLKLTYCTDTRPTASITENAKDADLFICEGMYGGNDKDDKAKENKHMTMNEAANIAKAANVKEMWLTHYSPSLPKPQEYKAEIRKIFPNTKVAKDGRSVTLVFED
ncbi:MAG: ribonuclease Z [Lachnospiraceae bacterium]|nr:ribonuclease Z [Lachnospiraceae bacterium]